jgi:1,4-alpha-glucan branching enzyme
VARIEESDLYLFNHGELERAWKVLGAHVVAGGVRFAVWAPYARRVAVVGAFNDWDGNAHPLAERGDTGIWEGIVEKARPGDLYKYELIDSHGAQRWKSDPFGFRMEQRPKTASLVWPLDGYEWGDADWMEHRAERQGRGKPLRVYEVHLGSWRKGRTYGQLADELVEYVAGMGFTHVELLPVSEFPYDGSWGYQVCGYYAATSRYGTPQELMALIDAFHRRGIGVFVDWVPAHFPKDDHGLYRFDGSHLFEHEDPRRGYHKDWDTFIFNYGRPEVRNFLASNALFWLEEFHFDGLRVDAVASMLYRDYSRQHGEWVPNDRGGNEDDEAIGFLRDMNVLVHEQAPGVLTIAEESTAFPGVTQPVEEGGLGFDLKWNMGWMHDTLEYIQHEPIYRRYHQGQVTFSLIYAFHENFVLPFSHDEVVHLKRSMLDKMPGDLWQKYANLRALYAYMYSHPGKKLLFMGAEFGQWREWNEARSLDWHLLDELDHRQLHNFVRDLNHIYLNEPALYEIDNSWEGFAWIDFNDADRSILSYVRRALDPTDHVVAICNLTPVPRMGYRIGLPENGEYQVLLNSDWSQYGGSGVGNEGRIYAEPTAWQSCDYSAMLDLPPLGVLYLKPARYIDG